MSAHVAPIVDGYGDDDAPPLEDGDEPTTWAPVDLGPILDGEAASAGPTVLRRSDGYALLYRGAVTAANAEPESLKTWLFLHATAELLGDGHRVAYLDFESSPERLVRERLHDALGVDTQSIRDRFLYVRPGEPFTHAARADYDDVLAFDPAGLFVDGVTEALGVCGLDGNSNADVARFLGLVARPAARAGAAVALADHVTKDSATRGRWALGAQHKLAGVDVAYSLQVVKAFDRGRDGLVKITVTKDRPGHVRGFAAAGKAAAVLRAHSDGDRVTLTLDPPDEPTTADGGEWRPTGYMEKVSRALEAHPDGLSTRQIEDRVSGKAGYVRAATTALIDDDYATVTPGPRGALIHRSTRPFRETP